MITPRVTRLLRAPDLRGLQRAIVDLLPPGLAARRTAVIVPTRGAAEQLRRTIEDQMLGTGTAILLPDLVTRGELYLRLHARLAGAAPASGRATESVSDPRGSASIRVPPPLLSEFEREVLLRLAADEAQSAGAPPPFRLRPGLLAAVLGFYDELRRSGRSIDTFDRLARSRLEPGSESDRGAARLLEQTAFLAETFAAFERRVADSGGIDEHGLRSLLLDPDAASPYTHVIVATADRAADPHGLWPVDFDLLARLAGIERLDLVATERMLAAGLHQRLHDALPGLVEERVGTPAGPPVLSAPIPDPEAQGTRHIVCRDREEELVAAARWIKHRARTAAAAGRPLPLERTAVVFQRPLPYLYLARQVFGSSRIPCQALDALPLAAEPFAAGLDVVLTAMNEEATRPSLMELLGSPQWRFASPDDPDRPLDRHDIAALDRLLRESKYLGGWSRLRALVPTGDAELPPHPRPAGEPQHRARRAVRAAIAAGSELESIAAAPAASGQIGRLLTFIRAHERPAADADPGHQRHLRARAAVLGALVSLRDAYAAHDDRPLAPGELAATIRRWIEGQTFTPRAGHEGVLLIDAAAAAFASADAVRIVGLVETDWPEKPPGNIFYPGAILKDLGWPPESARLSAARARFEDLLLLASDEVSVSAFTLEDDALAAASPFLEILEASALQVRPVQLPSEARIFAHEALSLAPLVDQAVSGSAGAWLQLRRARTASVDRRYHGSLGPRAPVTYAVSRVERYLACPFKYFAGHVLQLEEDRDDESGLTPQERGQLLHGVFEAFFTKWQQRGGTTITAETFGEAVALFAEVAASSLRLLPEADRALERTYLLGSAASPGLAERAFAFEIEHGVAVIERFVEYPFEGAFTFEGPDGSRQIAVRGKADRIDLLADGTLRVVDYKLGRAPKPSRVLQLPVYGICATQKLDGYRGRAWTLSHLGYVAFRERNPFVELGRGGNAEEALREGQERFVSTVERIEGGEFPPSPDEAWTCTRCGYPHVCRKDYVGDE